MNKITLLLILGIALLSFKISFSQNWLSGWAYRMPILINNTLNSNNLTDYQVLVTINTQNLISAGKMRSDCGDIRFTDSDGTTLLNYWIEGPINSSNTRIWVKVPNIPASSTKTIYLYYGNPNAASLSNGDLVFDFFDDFEGTSLNTNKWTVLGSSGATTSVSNGIFTITISSTSGGYYQIRSNIAVPFGVIIEARVNAGGTIGCRGLMPAYSTGTGVIRYDNDVPYGNYYAGAYLSNGADFYAGWSFGVRTADGSSTLATKSNFYSSGFGVWLKNRLIVTQNYQQAFIYDDNWNLLASSASSSNTLPSATYYVDLGNMWYNAGGTYSFQYDWVRVRKYTSPEPTISLGSEETIIIEIYFPKNETYYIANITFNFTVYGPENYYNVTAYLNNNVIYKNESYPNGTITTLNYLINLTGTYNFTVYEALSTKSLSVIFTIKDFEIVSISFNSNTYELSYENYSIIFRYNPDLVDLINTSLYFNNILANNYEDYKYSSFVNTTHINNNISITIPLSLNSANLIFENTIYYKNGTSYKFNTSSYTQNISQSVYILGFSSNKKDYVETEDATIYFTLADLFNKLTNVEVNVTFQNETRTFYEKSFNAIFELLPNNAINETRVFFANVSASYKSYSKTLSAQNSLNSYMMVLTNCSSLSTTKTLTFNFKDEENDSLIDYVTMYSNFDVWLKDKFKRNYGFNFYVNKTASICIYPTFAELITQGMIQYKAQDYIDRMYYIFTRINNVTQTVDLYLLSSDYAQTVYIYVTDQAGNSIQDAIVKVQRYYIDKNIYKTVAQTKTDFEGKGVTYLRVNEIYYKFIVEKNFTVLREFPPMLIVCQSGTCPPYIINLPIVETTESQIFKYLGKISYSCAINEQDEILRCTVSDVTQTMTKATLIVNKFGAFGSEQVCNNTCESSACTLICSVPNLNSTLYSYALIAELPNNLKYVIDTNWIDLRKGTIFGDLGILMALLTTLVLTFIGIWNPGVAITMCVFAVGISYFLGLIPIGFGALTALVISAIVLIYKMKT